MPHSNSSIACSDSVFSDPAIGLCYTTVAEIFKLNFWDWSRMQHAVCAKNFQVVRFERYRNAYRPHQAPGQPPPPMQAHSQHLDQNAIATLKVPHVLNPHNAVCKD